MKITHEMFGGRVDFSVFIEFPIRSKSFLIIGTMFDHMTDKTAFPRDHPAKDRFITIIPIFGRKVSCLSGTNTILI